MKPLLGTRIDNGVPVQLPLYYLRRIADKFPLNARAFSNTIPPALPNGGTDNEYLPIMTEDVPDSDLNYTIVTKHEDPNETLKQWEITYTVADKPLAEKLEAAANVERLEVTKQVPVLDQTRRNTLLFAAILRNSKGLALTPRELALTDEVVTQAAVLSKNLDNLEAKQAAIAAGQKPDIADGYAAIAADPVVP